MQFKIKAKQKILIAGILFSIPIILLFLSLDSNSGNFFEKNYFRVENFLQIREIFPHILLFLFLFLNLKLLKNKTINLNYTIIFTLLFFSLQLIGLIYAKYFNYRYEFFGGFHFLIIYFFLFNYLFFFYNYFNLKEKTEIFKIVLISLFISHLLLKFFFFIQTFFIFIGFPNQYAYGGYQFDYNFFGTVKKFVFNSNGISRSFLVFFIFVLCFGRNLSLKLTIFLRYFLLFLLTTIIYFLMILSSILFAKVINHHIYDFKNNPLYYKEKNSFFSNLFYKKIEGHLSNAYSSRTPDRIINMYSNSIIKSDNFLYDSEINIYTTGRFELISQAVDFLKSNKLLIFTGGGPEFDRYLVNTVKKSSHYKDIGNGYLNLILTGGFFLFISFILFIFYFFVSVMQMFQKFYKDNFFIIYKVFQ